MVVWLVSEVLQVTTTCVYGVLQVLDSGWVLAIIDIAIAALVGFMVMGRIWIRIRLLVCFVLCSLDYFACLLICY